MTVSTHKNAILRAFCAVILVWAADQALADDITFKKAKPAGEGKRIDVQIAPEDDWYRKTNREKLERQKQTDTQKEEIPAANVAPAVANPAGDLQDWFWSENSPAMADAAFDRMEKAVNTLSRNPSKSTRLAPRLATFHKLAETHGRDILIATLGKDVSPALILAVIAVESSGRSDAVSEAGAVGLMQLMEATAARFEVDDRTDPAQSIRGGAAYLSWLLKEFKGDPLLALAGYNAGENAVKSYNGVPPYPETRAYVPKVIAAWALARSLCMTVPKYPTDGCVFKKGPKT